MLNRPVNPSPPRRQRLRGPVLGLLSLCVGTSGALSLWTRRAEAPPDPLLTTIAVSLALLSIVARQFAGSPALARHWGLRLEAAALIGAAALGGLGLLLAMLWEAPRSGLLYSLAGVLFALRRSARPAGRRQEGGRC